MEYRKILNQHWEIWTIIVKMIVVLLQRFVAIVSTGKVSHRTNELHEKQRSVARLEYIDWRIIVVKNIK